ncbi:MAG: hypothetical protein OEY14_11765, partial [Myxococcales bacterium]|nr:hypothetical protein [Myxococcales bacterium]
AALVASALLVHRRRGMTRAELLRVCRHLLGALELFGAQVASAVRLDDGTIREDTLDGALGLFLDARLITQHETGAEAIYTIPEERRIALEYYKNNILHFFVPTAMIALAMGAAGGAAIRLAELEERVRTLSRLFKYEFMYRADAGFEVIFADALRAMQEAGWLRHDEGCRGDHCEAAPGELGELLGTFADMLRTYVESYLLATRAIGPLLERPQGRKEWIRRTLTLGQRMYLAGEIEQRESLSKPKLETALEALRDMKLLRLEGRERVLAGERLDEGEGARALERELRRLLR